MPRSTKRRVVDLIEDIGEDKPRRRGESRVREAIDLVETMRRPFKGRGTPAPPSRLPSSPLESAGLGGRAGVGGAGMGYLGETERQMEGSGMPLSHFRHHARFGPALHDIQGGGRRGLHSVRHAFEHITHGVASHAKALGKQAISAGLDYGTPAALTAVGSAFGAPELGLAAPAVREGIRGMTGYGACGMGGAGSGRFEKGSKAGKEWAAKMRNARKLKRQHKSREEEVMN